VIYLASPYSDSNPLVQDYRHWKACIVAAKLIQAGYHVYSPIAHTHALATAGDLPHGFGFWREYDFWFISHVDEIYVLMLPGWDTSVGVMAEIEMARQLGKRVTYLAEDGGAHASVKV